MPRQRIMPRSDCLDEAEKRVDRVVFLCQLFQAFNGFGKLELGLVENFVCQAQGLDSVVREPATFEPAQVESVRFGRLPEAVTQGGMSMNVIVPSAVMQ